MNNHVNGHSGNGAPKKPLSMMIQGGIDRDPLRPKRHQVVNAQGFIVHTSEEPIELLKLDAAKQHAVFSPNDDISIVDEEGIVVHQETSYFVEPQEGPPDEARIRLREKWMDNVMRFLLTPELFNHRNDEEWRPMIARFFQRRNVEVEMRPDGGAVRVWRDGAVLCSWGC